MPKVKDVMARELVVREVRDLLDLAHTARDVAREDGCGDFELVAEELEKAAVGLHGLVIDRPLATTKAA